MLLCSVVLYILFIRSGLEMASNALLISIVTRSVLCGGRLELMPSCTVCVRLVSSVVVEWFGLYPCCVGDSGMCGVILCSKRRSMTLDGVQSSVIGLYDAASVGVLFGLRIVIILPIFQMSGIMQCAYE